MKARIVFTVTGDLAHDQRMQRICATLAAAGYDVLLLGFRKVLPLQPMPTTSFKQIRLPLFFRSGPLFFCEANLRIFLYLLFKKFDVICAIDLDTIMPVYLLSILKNKKKVFDAYELFCETHELSFKPRIRRIWKFIETTFLPRFKYGYTVSVSLAKTYNAMYGLNYEVIRNAAMLTNLPADSKTKTEKIIIYQGVVDKGRGVEYFIPAMRHINAQLIICGTGDLFNEAIQLVARYQLQDKVELKGFVAPEKLKELTAQAYLGLNTIASKGLSYYYSLSNRTFDYIAAGVPQLAMNYPEYATLNQEFEVAILIDQLSERAIVEAVNTLLNNPDYYDKLKKNCREARQKLNWHNEAEKLLTFYERLLAPTQNSLE